MQVAVVILNWNGRSFLEKFLPSVIRNSPDAHIIVADNASSDGSVRYLGDEFPEVTVIENSENLGFAGGYNAALQGLKEEYFVLLNSDVEVTEGWLDPLVRLMDSDTDIAACQPKMLQYDRKTHFEYAGACGGFIDMFGYPFCRGRIFDTLEQDTGQYDEANEVFWASGACLLIRAAVYREMGGLDADLFAHMEEIDLCWRAKRAGYRIMAEPRSVVYHVGGGTLSRSNPRKTFLNFRNGLELLAKNLPPRRSVPRLLIRMLLDGVAAFRFLFSGQPSDAWAVIRAHGAFYSRLGRTLRKRTGRYPELRGIYTRSIVFDHFIRGMKTFTLLPKDGL